MTTFAQFLGSSQKRHSAAFEKKDKIQAILFACFLTGHVTVGREDIMEKCISYKKHLSSAPHPESRTSRKPWNGRQSCSPSCRPSTSPRAGASGEVQTSSLRTPPHRSQPAPRPAQPSVAAAAPSAAGISRRLGSPCVDPASLGWGSWLGRLGPCGTTRLDPRWMWQMMC